MTEPDRNGDAENGAAAEFVSSAGYGCDVTDVSDDCEQLSVCSSSRRGDREMEFDLKKPHCYFFNEICKIPHGSGNEKALSDWVVSFAKERGLAFLQDEMWNIVICKEASSGYETHPGVILQAHMDMVCEKTPESAHDFETDPLDLYVDGTHLRARGTTLGGDDCMGVAYMLDILSDETLSHPYLECCFTVQEETGLFGARALKPEYFKARRLINLDGAGEYRTYTTLAGSRNLTIEKKMTQSCAAGSVWRLRVEGLLGGRTGDDIGKERANAGKLLARVLYAFHMDGISFRLMRLTSSNKKSGIPSEGEAVFVTETGGERLSGTLTAVRAAVADEYEFSDAGIRFELEAWEPSERRPAGGEPGGNPADSVPDRKHAGGMSEREPAGTSPCGKTMGSESCKMPVDSIADRRHPGGVSERESAGTSPVGKTMGSEPCKTPADGMPGRCPVSSKPCGKTVYAASETDSLELTELLYLLPYGVFGRFLHLEGLPYDSANLGRIETQGDTVLIRYAARSPFESCMAEAERRVGLLCRKLNATIVEKDDYYGYRYRTDSPLRDTMDRVFLEQYKKPLAHVAAHGGNECGAFAHMFPDMDIVTSGAIYAKHHTPEEYLDLESFDRSIRFLKALLKEL